MLDFGWAACSAGIAIPPIVQPGDIGTFVTFVSGRSMFIKVFDTLRPR